MLVRHTILRLSLVTHTLLNIYCFHYFNVHGFYRMTTCRVSPAASYLAAKPVGGATMRAAPDTRVVSTQSCLDLSLSTLFDASQRLQKYKSLKELAALRPTVPIGKQTKARQRSKRSPYSSAQKAGMADNSFFNLSLTHGHACVLWGLQMRGERHWALQHFSCCNWRHCLKDGPAGSQPLERPFMLT